MPDAVVDGKPTPYFVAHPEALARPDIAAETMVTGMRDGTFSGRSLDHYIDGKKADYVGARHIVNGTDHTQEIARDAERFERAIEGTTLHRGHEPHDVKHAVERDRRGRGTPRSGPRRDSVGRRSP